MKCKCGKEMKMYDKVDRIVKTSYGKTYTIKIPRYVCEYCHHIVRVNTICYPYKHYEKSIIDGFLKNDISVFSNGYEDYPCEETVKRWKTEFLQLLY